MGFTQPVTEDTMARSRSTQSSAKSSGSNDGNSNRSGAGSRDQSARSDSSGRSSVHKSENVAVDEARAMAETAEKDASGCQAEAESVMMDTREKNEDKKKEQQKDMTTTNEGHAQ